MTVAETMKQITDLASKLIDNTNTISNVVMEDFVPFEIAKKLKEKGFDWDKITTYNSRTKVRNNHLNPTISQVLKWLRKEKNIFVVTFIADDSDTPLTYEIYIGTECLLTHHGEYFTLQEWDKCNLVGIEYVIDNLI